MARAHGCVRHRDSIAAGYGFSGKPTTPGWDVPRIARTWVTLMKRLGYTRFVAAGGDWGAQVVDELGVQAPPELLGIHTNMPGTVPDDVSNALNLHQPAPAGLSAEEKSAWDQLDFFYKKGLGYANEMALRPQTLYGLAIHRLAWPPGSSTTMTRVTR